MFSCKEISQKISLSMDDRLPMLHRLAIGMHLLMCRYCARFHRQLKVLRNLSRREDGGRLAPELPKRLSETARERMKVFLRSVP